MSEPSIEITSELLRATAHELTRLLTGEGPQPIANAVSCLLLAAKALETLEAEIDRLDAWRGVP